MATNAQLFKLFQSAPSEFHFCPLWFHQRPPTNQTAATQNKTKKKEKEKIRRRQKKPPGKAIRSDEIRVARLSGLNHRVTGSVRPSGRKSRIFSINLTGKDNKHPIESCRDEKIDQMSAEFALGAPRSQRHLSAIPTTACCIHPVNSALHRH